MASEDEMTAEYHGPSQSGRVLWGDIHREYILKDSGEVGPSGWQLTCKGFRGKYYLQLCYTEIAPKLKKENRT